MRATTAACAWLLAAAVALSAGCAAKPPVQTTHKSVSFAIHTAKDYETPGYDKTPLPSDDPKVRYSSIWVHPKVELDEMDVEDADVTHVVIGSVEAPRKEAAVAVTMTAAGRGKLKTLTGRRDYSRLAIFVNRKLIMAPYVQGRITSGKMLIYGNLDDAEAAHLAAALSGHKQEPQFNLPQ